EEETGSATAPDAARTGGGATTPPSGDDGPRLARRAPVGKTGTEKLETRPLFWTLVALSPDTYGTLLYDLVLTARERANEKVIDRIQAEDVRPLDVDLFEIPFLSEAVKEGVAYSLFAFQRAGKEERRTRIEYSQPQWQSAIAIFEKRTLKAGSKLDDKT